MTAFYLACLLFSGGLETVRDYTVPNTGLISGIPIPVSVAAGPDGRVFLLEGANHKVLIWNKDGSFERAFGEKGRGAGKLMLNRTPKSHPAGFLDVRDDGIYVYDGGQSRMHVFDPKTYALTDSYTFKVKPGQPIYLGVVTETQLLVNWINLENGRDFNAALFNPDKYTSKLLAERPDYRAKHAKDENGIMLLTYSAFSPELAAIYDARNNHILWGDGAEPTMYRLEKSADGSWQRTATINIAIEAEDILAKDQSLIRRQPFLLQGGNTEIKYPKKRPYYNDILTYGESGYLIAYRFPAADRIYGVHVDKEGKILGNFDKTVEKGELFKASRGRVFHAEIAAGLFVHELGFK